MHGLLFLLYCVEILGTLLCRAQNSTESLTTDSDSSFDQKNVTMNHPITSGDMPESGHVVTSVLPTAVSHFSITKPTPIPNPKAIMPNILFSWREYFSIFLVTGGLIIACTILLVSTVLLSWKVCQLSRRIKALSSNVELISNSDYWMGSAKRMKRKSEAGPAESNVLMVDLGEAQWKTDKEGAAEEEGGMANMDKKKEAGSTTDGGDASTPSADSSSSSKPQEAEAAPTSEDPEEPKEVV